MVIFALLPAARKGGRHEKFKSTGLKIRHQKTMRRYNRAQTILSALLKELGDFVFELGLLERATLDFVEADGVHKKFGTQEPQQLAHV